MKQPKNIRKGLKGTFSIPIETRFWEKVDKKDENECWLWQGYKVPRGYGMFWNGIYSTQAHIVSYRLNIGEVPEGNVIDHICNNPSCVNPNHLNPTTQQKNVQRGMDLKKPYRKAKAILNRINKQ